MSYSWINTIFTKSYIFKKTELQVVVMYVL